MGNVENYESVMPTNLSSEQHINNLYQLCIQYMRNDVNYMTTQDFESQIVKYVKYYDKTEEYKNNHILNSFSQEINNWGVRNSTAIRNFVYSFQMEKIVKKI